MSTTFADLQINAPLVAILRDQKMETPTPVQVEAIPLILAGRDALIESPTGTGKTFAYLLPLLTKIDMDKKDVQVLVLAPTHELVVQIAKEAEKLLPGADHAVLPIIGGVDVKRQVERLKKKPVLVVATPGRLLELIDQRKLKVHEVKTVVVDEADRMLDAGFGKPVQEVMKKHCGIPSACCFPQRFQTRSSRQPKRSQKRLRLSGRKHQKAQQESRICISSLIREKSGHAQTVASARQCSLLDRFCQSDRKSG